MIRMTALAAETAPHRCVIKCPLSKFPSCVRQCKTCWEAESPVTFKSKWYKPKKKVKTPFVMLLLAVERQPLLQVPTLWPKIKATSPSWSPHSLGFKTRWLGVLSYLLSMIAHASIGRDLQNGLQSRSYSHQQFKGTLYTGYHQGEVILSICQGFSMTLCLLF
jgi:hypothetical protein